MGGLIRNIPFIGGQTNFYKERAKQNHGTNGIPRNPHSNLSVAIENACLSTAVFTSLFDSIVPSKHWISLQMKEPFANHVDVRFLCCVWLCIVLLSGLIFQRSNTA